MGHNSDESASPDSFLVHLSTMLLTEHPRCDSDAVIFSAEVVSQIGNSDPKWRSVIIEDARCAVPVDTTCGSDITVPCVKMDLPPKTKPESDGWDLVLFHLCETPDPELVEEWMAVAARINPTVDAQAEVWLEVDAQQDAAQDWGEVHLTRINGVDALRELYSHPLWLSNQALHDAVVGMQYQVVTQPVIDRLALLG